MYRKVALFHTSMVFFGQERLLFDLFEEIVPEVELINIIEDKMLKEVMAHGHVTPNVTRRLCLYAQAAESMEVEAIFSTCSTVGPAVDVARQLVSTPIVKIDDAMTESAARNGTKIGVLATVPTTLKPTVDLIYEKADNLKRNVQIREALSDGAFELLMQDETDRHDAMVAKEAKQISQWADTLVLAQCSMARLASRLSDETGLPVLSSPRLGVIHLKEILEDRR